MKSIAQELIRKARQLAADAGLADKAADFARSLQDDAPWLLDAAARVPLAPRVLGPLLVASRYRPGSRPSVPEHGMPAATLLEMLEFYRSFDMKGPRGRVFAYFYDAGPEAETVAHAAYLKYLKENALDPTVCPSVLALENELVEMAKAHVNAPAEAVGNFTTGGTESIMLAVKTARDWARAHRPKIKQPEMILPITGHAAFQKAAHYLCVKPVLVTVDPRSFRADVEAIRRAINRNTILLVGSAPSYAHGVIDPIREIGGLAEKHDLLFHVDACVGGFLLHYLRELGVPLPDYDFRVSGVTSMSMDLHKYGFAPKGASIVLHRHKELRRHQIFTCANWTGYTIVNPTVLSTRTGGPVAAAWTVMNFLGRDGYARLAREMYKGAQRLIEGIRRIPDLRVMGEPDMNLIAVTSDTVNVFHIADEMRARNWYIQPQLGLAGHKENFHFSVAAQNVPFIDDLLKDLAEATAAAKKLPTSDLVQRIRREFGQLDPGTMTEDAFWRLLGMAGIKGVNIPDRLAAINGVLNSLSPAMADALLSRFFNEMGRFNDGHGD